MHRPVAAIACLLSCCIAAQAGVVIVMESGDASSGGETAVDTIYAEGEMLRIDPRGSRRGKDTSMLFRDDTLYVVDHDSQVVQRIDREGMDDLSARMHDAMAHMEAEMAKLPPEQREILPHNWSRLNPCSKVTFAPAARIRNVSSEIASMPISCCPGRGETIL